MAEGRCLKVKKTESGRWQVQRLREESDGTITSREIMAIYTSLPEAEKAVLQQIRHELRRMRSDIRRREHAF